MALASETKHAEPPAELAMEVATAVLYLEAALQDLDPADTGLASTMLSGTSGASDTPIPAASVWVQRKLGIAAPAFDVNAACAGFSFALSTATGQSTSLDFLGPGAVLGSLTALDDGVRVT